jgi:hypothetical protein
MPVNPVTIRANELERLRHDASHRRVEIRQHDPCQLPTALVDHQTADGGRRRNGHIACPPAT